MRAHSNVIRYALMAAYLNVRAMEVTDDITRMAIDLIHRLDTRSEKQIHREFLADLKRVDGKMQILSRVAEAVVEQRTVSSGRSSSHRLRRKRSTIS